MATFAHSMAEDQMMATHQEGRTMVEHGVSGGIPVMFYSGETAIARQTPNLIQDQGRQIPEL